VHNSDESQANPTGKPSSADFKVLKKEMAELPANDARETMDF